MAEIVLRYPLALVALPVMWLLFLLFAWRRRFKPLGAFLLRLLIVVLAVLALAQPVRLPPSMAATAGEQDGRLVVLVDQSASLTPAQRQTLRTEAGRLAGEAPDSTILFFADQAVVVPSARVDPDGLPLNPEITDLAGALDMGARLLGGRPGRLMLLSDGVPTAGNTQAAIDRLAEQGIRVDVLPLAADTTLAGEVRLVRLNVPPILRQGESFTVEIAAHSLAPITVTLELTQDDGMLAQDVVRLNPGLNPFSFEVKAGDVGVHTFQAAVAPDAGADDRPVNNSLSALAQVYPAPQVLVVGDELVQTARFASYLEEAGFTPRRIRPATLPTRLSELEPYAGMVLVDVSARALELEQMIAVQEFVRSLGRGLLVTGGRNSFSLGNYQDTPLADLLPVSLEPPPREERPPVALLLMIDHSGSMVEQGQTTKLVMAKEAAIRATDILGPEDLIGVLIFDDTYEWIVPFQQVSDGAALLEIQRRIATIPAGGGTHILDAMEEGLPALAAQSVGSSARHAVLLTDGRSFDGTRGITDYDRVVDAALEAKITLSTIAIGTGADQDLLARLAERGQGRYHFAAVPEELPALTIAESAILRSNALQEGDFRPAVAAPHPLLRGLFAPDSRVPGDELPDLTGYVALTPKPRAEMPLQVGPGDPLLTVWGYGLGRVAAWSADTGAEWAGDWLSWPKFARFWGQLVGYTLPTPGLGLLQLSANVEPDGVVTLSADGVTATGQTVDLAPTQATLTTPAGREVELNLRQVAPGRYQQRLHLPDPGAYRLTVTQARPGNEPDETATTGFVVPYPAEYGLPAKGTGRPLLQQIAAATGGQVIVPGEAAGRGDSTLEIAPANRPPLELWPWLLLGALLLWPLEIAWRRWGRLRIQ